MNHFEISHRICREYLAKIMIKHQELPTIGGIQEGLV